MNLFRKKCKPCEGGVPPLPKEKINQYLKELLDWELIYNDTAIRGAYSMKNFSSAIETINHIAEIAESEDHHPDIHLTGYRNLVIEISTHAIGGLTENDFILASKIEKLPKNLK